MRLLMCFLLACLAFTSAPGDTFRASPLDLTAAVERHDAEIDTLTIRVSRIEDRLDEVLAAVNRSAPAAAATPENVKSSPVKTAAAFSSIKSAADIRAELKRKWTRTLYADVRPRTAAAIRSHLITGAPEHRVTYQPEQLTGLTTDELWMLHNLAHSPQRVLPTRSAAVTSTRTVITTEQSVPPPIVPTPNNPGPPPTPRPPSGYNGGGGCANGRCAIRATQGVSGRWYPGKLLFGR